MAAAGGQDAVTAATAAMGAEVAAPLLAQYLYGKTPQTLSADEKTTISAITGFVGAGVGALSGSDASLVQATQLAMTAVDENALSRSDRVALVQAILDCEAGHAKACQQQALLLERSAENDKAVLAIIDKLLSEQQLSSEENTFFQSMWEGAYTQHLPAENINALSELGADANQKLVIRRSLLQADKVIPLQSYAAAHAISTYEPSVVETVVLPMVVDFTPIVGDVKAFWEAEGAIDYAFAATGIFPILSPVISSVKHTNRAGKGIGSTKLETGANKSAPLNPVRVDVERQLNNELFDNFTKGSRQIKNAELTISGRTIKANPMLSKSAAVFDGVSDSEVKQYFMSLTGQAVLPTARQLPGMKALDGSEGLVYAVKKDGLTYNLRNASASQDATKARWTIEVTGTKGYEVGERVLKSPKVEVKFR